MSRAPLISRQKMDSRREEKEFLSKTIHSHYFCFRVSPEMYESVKSIPLLHGELVYHSTANIVSMIPSRSTGSKVVCEESLPPGKRVVVATAGTTDLPVAEEAAVVLEAAQCKVDRIYDVGVAGLHRVIKALPRLQDPEVGCIIVCAG